MKKVIICCFAAFSLMANAEHTIKVTVENPSKDIRTDAPVVVQLGSLGMSVSSALVKDGEKEIPCQLDDLNGDKRYDELCFTTDLGKREKKTFEITFTDEGKPRQYTPKVFIEMVLPNRNVKIKNKQDYYISELTVDRGVDAYRVLSLLTSMENITSSWNSLTHSSIQTKNSWQKVMVMTCFGVARLML